MKLFSFNKQASNYVYYSSLQNKIAKYLTTNAMNVDIHRVLDLGAGSGNVIRNLIDYKIDYFLGIDNSINMLSLHPKKMDNISHIELRSIDFENYCFNEDFDLIIASSSLHWAKDIESIFFKMKSNYNVAFSIFTNKSLESLHSFLDSTSPLKSCDEIKSIINKYFIGEFETIIYKENFDDRDSLLNHLKYSGLLGGSNISFSSKKRLKFEFPNLFLEYEVLFFIGKVR